MVEAYDEGNEMNLNEWIKHHRQRRRWSQPDLAQRLQVDETTVSTWENARRTPRYEMVVRMALLFNAPMPGPQPTEKYHG